MFVQVSYKCLWMYGNQYAIDQITINIFMTLLLAQMGRYKSFKRCSLRLLLIRYIVHIIQCISKCFSRPLPSPVSLSPLPSPIFSTSSPLISHPLPRSPPSLHISLHSCWATSGLYLLLDWTNRGSISAQFTGRRLFPFILLPDGRQL